MGAPEPTTVMPRRSILRTYGFKSRFSRMNSSTVPSAVIFEMASDFPPGPAFKATVFLPSSGDFGGMIMCIPTTRTAFRRLGELNNPVKLP